MTLEGTRRQKTEQLELTLEARGEAPHGQRSGEVPTATTGTERSGSDHRLMEAVVERANAIVALKRVRQNQGSPGIDKQRKRGTTTFKAARAYGLSVDAAVMVASHNRRWWHFARLATHLILPTREIDALGVPRLGR